MTPILYSLYGRSRLPRVRRCVTSLRCRYIASHVWVYPERCTYSRSWAPAVASNLDGSRHDCFHRTLSEEMPQVACCCSTCTKRDREVCSRSVCQ